MNARLETSRNNGTMEHDRSKNWREVCARSAGRQGARLVRVAERASQRSLLRGHERQRRRQRAQRQRAAQHNVTIILRCVLGAKRARLATCHNPAATSSSAACANRGTEGKKPQDLVPWQQTSFHTRKCDCNQRYERALVPDHDSTHSKTWTWGHSLHTLVHVTRSLHLTT